MKNISFHNTDQSIERKRKMAQALMDQSTKERPTEMVSGYAVKQSPLAGLARALQGGIAGYELNQADNQEAQKQQNAQQTMADALGAYSRSQAGGTTTPENGDTISWNKAPIDQSAQMYQKILMGNADTAPLGMQAAMGQMQSKQDAAQELDMFKQKMPFELELARAKAAITKDSTGGDTGALLDRLVQVGREGDPKYNLLSALQDLKGGAGQTGRNLADINLGREANFEKQSGQNESDLEYKPTIAGLEKTEELKATAQDKINTDIAAIDDFDASVKRFNEAIDKTSYTGPVQGRVGNAIADPARTDLVSAQNELVLRAKGLLGMPSANFSDADRDFISAIAGGQFGRKEGLKKVAQRLSTMAKEQRQNLQGRQTGPQGQGSNPAITQPYDQIKPEVNWEDLP